MPAFLKGGTEAPGTPAGGAATSKSAGAQDAELHPKEIGKVAPVASIMLEKNCPNLVQPYRLTDNLASLGVFAEKQAMGGLGNMLPGLTGKSAPAPQTGIPASTRLAAKQLNWLPMNVEKLYGERLHRQETNVLSRETKLGRKYYPIADKMLQDILAHLGQSQPYDFQLFILKSAAHNALSRPGGYLYVDQGLLDKPALYPKAYFAIAHELAHELQRHETMELQSQIIDSISIEDDLTKTIASAGANPEAVLAHVKTGKNMFIRHHIDQELQADSCAARMLSRVFPERQELANSLNAFLKDLPKPEPEKQSAPPQSEAERLAASLHDVVESPIKVHPNSLEREDNLRAMYAEISRATASSAAKAP
jgi:hypothetical protein